MTEISEFTIETLARGTENARMANRITQESWPEFLMHSAVSDELWPCLYDCFGRFQFVFKDASSGGVLLVGNCFPLRFDDPIENLPQGGLEWALQTAVMQHRQGTAPNMLCAYQIVVDPNLRGSGLSYKAVGHMVKLAREAGLNPLIAPVRPNRKEHLPTTQMEAYAHEVRDDGLPKDDWLRVHARLGGRILKVCHRSYIVAGTLSEWREWTGLPFDQSGPAIVPVALVPVEVDLKANRGIYVEPNVWVIHPVT